MKNSKDILRIIPIIISGGIALFASGYVIGVSKGKTTAYEECREQLEKIVEDLEKENEKFIKENTFEEEEVDE